MLKATKKLNPNGTGMGLSICKQIAEYLGGSTSVRSNTPKGSIFGFWFSCKIPSEEQLKKAGLFVAPIV